MRRYLSHPRVGRQRYGPLKRVRSSRSKRSLPFRRAVWAVGLYDIHPMRRGGVKSIVDDFVLGRGVVISRAATSLRSVETQPLTRRFVRTRRTHLRYNVNTRLRQAAPPCYDTNFNLPCQPTKTIYRYAGSTPAPGFTMFRLVVPTTTTDYEKLFMEKWEKLPGVPHRSVSGWR